MTVLLDVNVLVALSWPNHPHHDASNSWFDDYGSRDWATCAITESGFVRISCNPAAVQHAVTLSDAIISLRHLRSMGGHTFWPLEHSIVELLAPLARRVQGYRQISDAVLLATAMQHNGELATLDGGMATLLSTQERRLLRIIPV